MARLRSSLSLSSRSHLHYTGYKNRKEPYSTRAWDAKYSTLSISSQLSKGTGQKEKKRDCVCVHSILQSGISSTSVALRCYHRPIRRFTEIKQNRKDEKPTRQICSYYNIRVSLRPPTYFFIYTLSIWDDGPTSWAGQHWCRASASTTSSTWKPRPSHRRRLRYWNGHVKRNSNEPSYLSWRGGSRI